MNLVERGCPWCGVVLKCPKAAVEQAVKDSKTMPCPNCDVLFAFTGEWQDVEETIDMSEYEHVGTVNRGGYNE